ncbi:Flagellar basal body rod protein FlgB [Ferriphaselus amnicola]|uniref:Flagellar basal body rod protein FlgB n=1 Tax=Ferriphaselus amnicola TaxID=1188319 RepID=A0A2Z6GCU9_9PROT|nr:flagellar basal body rod protein FlgB [Ferriphaselus amnicola]BBE51348.1 Flagellar basal body rod protein FlgB [Ferriphaselus amnicola]
MSSRIDQVMQFHQTALSLRAARQELLASNIANADTPNYKARDIDFASALQGAMAGRTGGLSMATTSSRHLEGSGQTSALMAGQVKYRNVVQPSADGNTVDMDVERAQFADNALRYEASVKFAGDKLKDVLTALQG